MSFDIKTQVWDWLSVAVLNAIPDIDEDDVDQRVVWSMQHATPELAPYVSLHLAMLEDDNAVEIRNTFNDDPIENPNFFLHENVLVRGKGVVVVSVFGLGAVLHCFNIKAALREWRTIEAMNNAKLGLVGVGGTQNVGDVIGTAFEERASFTLDFYYAAVKVVDKPTIGHVPLKGSIDLVGQVVDTVIDEP